MLSVILLGCPLERGSYLIDAVHLHSQPWLTLGRTDKSGAFSLVFFLLSVHFPSGLVSLSAGEVQVSYYELICST